MKKMALYASLTAMAKTEYDQELLRKYESMSLAELEDLLEEVDGDFADAQDQNENPLLLKHIIKYKKLQVAKDLVVIGPRIIFDRFQ